MENKFRDTLYDGANICVVAYTYMCATYVHPITTHRRIHTWTNGCVEVVRKLTQNSDWRMKREKERRCTRNGKEMGMKRRKETKLQKKQGKKRRVHACKTPTALRGWKAQDIGWLYSEFLHYWFVYASNYKRSCLYGNISAHFY